MLGSRKLLIGVVGIFCATSVAIGAPILDGTINLAEGYGAPINDADGDIMPNGQLQYFEGPGWNIQSAHLFLDASWLYVGLHTLDKIDMNGTDAPEDLPTSFHFWIAANETSATWKKFVLEGDESGQHLYRGSYPIPASEIASWQCSFAGGDLEFKLPASEVAGIGIEVKFYARLDDNGEYPDDVIRGSTSAPEPGAMALLAAGAVGIVARRRRRH